MKTDFTPDFRDMVNILLWNSFGLFFLDFLIPYIASVEIHATGTQIGILFAIRTVGYLLIAPLAGNLTDKILRKKLIYIGSIGRGIAYFILYFSILEKSLEFIIFGNLLLGLMAGFFWIPLDVLISEKSNPSNRSEAFGIRNAKVGQGTIVGNIIGFGILGAGSLFLNGNRYLMYSALLVFGLSNFYGGTKFYRNVDESIKYHTEVVEAWKVEDKSYLQFFKDLPSGLTTILMLLLVLLFISSVKASTAKPFILVYLTQNIESDPFIASLVYVPAGLASVLLAPYLGKIGDRLNPKIVIGFGSILGAIVTWTIINTNSLIVFSILLLFDELIVITTELMIQNVFSKISIANRGKVFALETLFVDFGAVIGPIFGGVLWDAYGFRAPFIFSIFVELLLIPFFFIAFTRFSKFERTNQTESLKNTIIPNIHLIPESDPI